jgi:FkbM family methyltransferase
MFEMVKAKLNGKYEIVMPQHRADRPEWYTKQGWEKKRLDHMHENIGTDDVVYYVGAEEGEMCALLAIWGADLVMFEPNERVWPNIKAIWQANELKDPILYKGFASNKTTDEAIYIGFDTVTGEVIHDHGFKELKDPSDIPQIKIDDVTEMHMKFPPTMITMDVEGSEGEVLRGAEQTLRKYKPKIYLSLHPEFLHEQYGEWAAELRKWITDLGYTETLLDYPLHEVHLYYEATNG